MSHGYLRQQLKLKSQRPTSHTGNKLLPKESGSTLQTVALNGWMLTNQRACSTFDRRGQPCQSDYREQDSVLFFQVHSLLWTKVGVWHFLENPQIDSIYCEQQRSSCSDFNYNYVQCKRKTTTLIPISLRCNPLSASFVFRALFSSQHLFSCCFPHWGLSHSLQAADIGKALQFLRKVIFVQDGVSTMLHHFERHGPKNRGKLIDAFRSGEKEGSIIKNSNNWAGYQLPYQNNR